MQVRMTVSSSHLASMNWLRKCARCYADAPDKRTLCTSTVS